LGNIQTHPKPTVSIVIPAYNTASLIGTCLDSVLSQTYRDFEIMVVNDGSPDTAQLEQALRPYRDKIIYIVQENKRAAGARNTAIRQSRGEFLAFLDSDDSWFPEHLASQMELFDQDPNVDLTYADALLISDGRHQKRFTERCPSQGEATFESLVVEQCQIPISTVVARKAAILQAGLFDESLVRCDDYDMWLRTAFFGRKIAYTGRLQARLYQGRPDSLGLSLAKMSEADLQILEKLAQTLPLTEAQRKIVNQRVTGIRARYLLEEGKVQLREGHPERARQLLAEANVHLRRFRLSLAIQGLRLAPQSAAALISVWNRWRGALMVR